MSQESWDRKLGHQRKHEQTKETSMKNGQTGLLTHTFRTCQGFSLKYLVQRLETLHSAKETTA